MVANFFVAVLTGYITFTNALADQLVAWLPGDTPAPTEHVSEPDPLPSDYNSVDSIPRILLDNLRYQSAVVSESQRDPGAYTTDPEAALVNIYCTYTTDDSIRTTTGTGFFVSPDGVILTNAHVAQFLLLENVSGTGDTECVVRTGDPATPRYQASLLYLPPAWVQANASAILEERPIGTGERDYALLYADQSVSNEPLPAQFPALAVDTALLPRSTVQTPVIAAGYPVAPQQLADRSAPLPPTTATTSVTNLYTFGSNYADVISLQGSDVGTSGASGGPVLTADGTVIGLITTRGDDTLDGSGSLRAITLSYIDRTIDEETGFPLERNLSGNIPFRAQVFSDTLLPFLSSMLEREL